jgi:HK97 gp10 family phage protein
MPDQNINIQVEITDNSPEVLAALKTAVGRALWAMGAKAEGYAKQNAPVDTGRLRNSITHQDGEKETVIGSNVEYAAAQELGTSRGIRPKHYLQNAVANHTDEYKGIVKDSLANV